MKELFERLNLFEQLFSFIGVFYPNAMVGEILQERAAVDIRAGENRLFPGFE